MKVQLTILLLVSYFLQVSADALGQAPNTPVEAQQGDVVKPDKFVAKALDNIEAGNYEGALRTLEVAIVLKNNIKDSSGIADIHALNSTIYQKQGNQAKAISSLLNAIKIHEALGDQKNTAFDYHSMGVVYEKQKMYGKAEDSFLKANSIFEGFEDNKSKEHTASIMFDLSEIKLKQEETQKALEYGEKSAERYELLESKEGLAKAKLSIGNAHLQFEKYDLAERYYMESLDLLKGDNYPFLKARIDHQLSKVYLKQNKLNEALNYAKKAQFIFESSGTTIELRDTYETLSLIYESKKQTNNALQYFKKHLQYSKLGFDEESKRIEQELLTKYESQKKEAEIKLLEQEQKTKEEAIIKQRFQIVSFAVLGLFLALLAAGLIYYNRNIQSAKNQIAQEKERSENLLLNILPKDVAGELKEHGKYQARSFPLVSVLFVDIAGFTQYAETLSPEELVKDIDTYFSAFDEIVGRFEMEKIKTIGDAYMVAGGLKGDPEKAAVQMVKMGLAFQEEIHKINLARIQTGKEIFEMRMGIHTGPVVAGIVGSRKFAYDIWGDTVNIASRMQSSGEVNKLNISQSTYALVKDQFECNHRGKIDAKNKGAIEMYFVSPKL